MKSRFWIVSAIITYLGVVGCVMWSSDSTGGKTPYDSETEPLVTPAKLEGLPYRGLSMPVQRIDNLSDYTSNVDKIADLGADTILLKVDSKQENTSSTKIFVDVRQTPSPEKLGELIQYCHQRKLRVILMPIVLLESPKKENDWRGTIHPELWEDWWESYREMLHHYASVAEKNHAEAFVVGSELVSTQDQFEQWTRTIRQVRKEFHGQLTYSANWDRYNTIGYWDQLDFIGLNSYYKLGATNDASKAEIERKWGEIQPAILGFGQKMKRPVVLLEVGWCSMHNAVTEPWDYTVTTVPLDLQIQKRLYEAFLESWYGKKGFGGFIMFEWTPNAYGPEDRGYTPEGKPAEQVLRQWLAKGPWQVQ